MNGRHILVGFVLSFAVSVACDDSCPHRDRGYLPCDDECDLAHNDPDATERCLAAPTAEVCANICQEDADCEGIERLGVVYAGACSGDVCVLPCADTAACPRAMSCTETSFGKLCMWEYPA